MTLNASASQMTEKVSTELDFDFDYGELSCETRNFVEQRTFEIKSLLRQSAREMIEIGQKLIEVKEQLGHGNFGSWLKAEFGWGITTAWKLMKVAEAFKSSQCENLEIATSAIYLLASPSTPAAARQEALKRASCGEKITPSKAKDIIAEYRETTKLESDETSTIVAMPARAEEELDKSDTCKTLLFSTPPMSRASEAEDSSYSAIIEAVLQCLGEIDLHLGSRSYYGQQIPALTQLTEENGLAAPWRGRVFINLPDTNAVNDFVDKLCIGFESGHLTEALALFPAQLSTQWFRRLRQYPRCFLSEQVKFFHTDNRESSPSVVFYLGHEPDGLHKFMAAFNELGDIFVLANIASRKLYDS